MRIAGVLGALSCVLALAAGAGTPGRVTLVARGYLLTLSWNCAPGGQYVVSCAANLSGPWQELATEPKPLVAADAQLSYTLTRDGETRFYRVLELNTAAPAGTVWIPPGSFVMGSPMDEMGRQPDEGPQHHVQIERGFWMGKFEVTQGEYLKLMGNNPSQYPGDLSRPVESVSWEMATNYCARLTERQQQLSGGLPPGYVYRLPTEAEWEYACRAGTSSRFSHGEDPGDKELGRHAWYGVNGEGAPHPVGQKLPNPWGLYDMHGNVFELCLDPYGGYDAGAEVSPWHIMRGGSFYCPAWVLRSACRNHVLLPDRVSNLGGFRVVLGPVS